MTKWFHLSLDSKYAALLSDGWLAAVVQLKCRVQRGQAVVQLKHRVQLKRTSRAPRP